MDIFKKELIRTQESLLATNVSLDSVKNIKLPKKEYIKIKIRTNTTETVFFINIELASIWENIILGEKPKIKPKFDFGLMDCSKEFTGAITDSYIKAINKKSKSNKLGFKILDINEGIFENISVTEFKLIIRNKKYDLYIQTDSIFLKDNISPEIEDVDVDNNISYKINSQTQIGTINEEQNILLEVDKTENMDNIKPFLNSNSKDFSIIKGIITEGCISQTELFNLTEGSTIKTSEFNNHYLEINDEKYEFNSDIIVIDNSLGFKVK